MDGSTYPRLAGAGLALVAIAAVYGISNDDHRTPASVSEAKDAMSDVVASLDSDDLESARRSFQQAHEPLHATAGEVEPVDPETTEVLNDITEYFKSELGAPDVDRLALLDSADRTLAWLETAHVELEK